MSIVWA
jgi:hypothetical protein